ncbi:MAG: 1-deoxy-D-xylulose-5-phosphate reductoisomerase [Desulfobacterales bacterium]|nr:1-deoxy-D-xylulose-5-phosphate reductoisomerase [Desulfobacterales bacterium]NNL42206.1 1-deoxy-D-xylulose-5-phosphate reductoisomerase [Desulfobacterales bacterium]
MKHLSILGSTGSIGKNALKIVEQFPKRFRINALTAKTNVALLAQQIDYFSPELAVVFDEETAAKLKNILPTGTRVEVMYGEEGYNAAATLSGTDMVVAAMVGAAGLMPTLAAIDAGKDIALANKETLVMAGEIVVTQALEKGVNILPVDSEHSAIFQCIAGSRMEDLDQIFLTGSGGPFLNRSTEEFATITPEDALNHPVWQMGRKISIDSATMMNKGLEVLEAKSLFGVTHDKIKVLIQPQSVIHSMVSFKDGTVMAQLSIPDMKGAIAYALSYPERLPLYQEIPDFTGIGALTFQKPDLEKFPCLALAYEACETGRTLPAVLNAANEMAVNAFLNQGVSFTNIFNIIDKTMESHKIVKNPILSDIIDADQWARKKADEMITRL